MTNEETIVISWTKIPTHHTTNTINGFAEMRTLWYPMLQSASNGDESRTSFEDLYWKANETITKKIISLWSRAKIHRNEICRPLRIRISLNGTKGSWFFWIFFLKSKICLEKKIEKNTRGAFNEGKQNPNEETLVSYAFLSTHLTFFTVFCPSTLWLQGFVTVSSTILWHPLSLSV